jgi:hypothetical protein
MYLLKINNPDGSLFQTLLYDEGEALVAGLPGGFSLSLERAETSEPRFLPHEYCAPARVPERGHMALPCQVCDHPFGAALHRRR